MSMFHRLSTPVDQKNIHPGDQYCTWETPMLPSDWQIKLGAVTVGKNSDWCIDRVEGLGLPGTRTADAPNRFMHGTTALGDLSEPRTITIEGSGKFSSPQEAWTKLRELAGVWQTNVWAQPLIVRIVDDETHMLMGHPRNLEANTDAIYRGIVYWTAQFHADDPRFYSAQVAQEKILMDAAIATDGYCFDTGAPCQFTVPAAGTICIPRGESGNRTIVNRGNTRTAPIIWVVGDFTEIRAENTVTGDWFQWNGTTGGGTLAIDCLGKRVTLDGTEVYQHVEPGSTFFWLDAGETRVNMRADSGAGYANVRYRHAWF